MDFESVYRLYFRDVLLYVSGLAGDGQLAEEITQETFEKALKNIKSFDGSKDIRAWLFTIARNAYFSRCRKEKRIVEIPDEGALVDSGISFVEAMENGERVEHIYEFLHEMKEPYKEVFMLRIFGELPYDSIGRIFGRSASWARVTFYRAKKMIVDFMEEYDE